MTVCIYYYDGASFSSIYFRIKVLAVFLLCGRAVHDFCLYLLYCFEVKFFHASSKTSHVVQVIWAAYYLTNQDETQRSIVELYQKIFRETLETNACTQNIFHKALSLLAGVTEGDSLMNSKQILSVRTRESFPWLEKTSKTIKYNF